MKDTDRLNTEPFDEGTISEIDNGNIVDGTGVDVEEYETITEPFDPALIRVETKSMSIDLLLSRIQHGEIDLAPDFQRQGGIWSPGAKSRLVESILIRIPLPAFYMDATDEDRWIVVDGLQRLTTLKEFAIDKTIKLSGLEFLTQLEDKIYDELPRIFQRRIQETQVTVYLIEKGTPPEVKFNIFRRINTGGLPLSAQEIRHALNQGKVTNFLKNLAGSSEFKKATAGSVPRERMADREFVLRFLAFKLTPYTEYESKEFDSFLSDAMAEINKMPDQELKNLEHHFKRAMAAAFDIFERDAFRKRYKLDGGRYPINKALFESWSVNLSRLKDQQLDQLKERRETVREKFIELMNNRRDNPYFDTAISQGTGDIAKVKRRFSAIETLIKEVLV